MTVPAGGGKSGHDDGKSGEAVEPDKHSGRKRCQNEQERVEEPAAGYTSDNCKRPPAALEVPIAVAMIVDEKNGRRRQPDDHAQEQSVNRYRFGM